MKLKFGALVVAGRGKIGGHVASRNRSGAYLRTKVTPVNPATTSQTEVRSRFSGLSSGWRSLTAAQRNSFLGAVQAYATTDIFGDLKNPSGSNLYQRLNNNLLTIGESAITTAPAVAAVPTMSSMSLAAAAGAQSFGITFAPVIPATVKFKVFATQAVSAGVNFVKSEYRLIGVADSTDTSVLDYSAEYIAKFGAVGAAGGKIFVKLVPVLVASGLEGTAITASAIIAA